METDQAQREGRGALAVQVCALPVVAGTQATVTLIVRNPFPEPIFIESIEAPRSEPLLPRRTREDVAESSFLAALGETFTQAFKVSSISAGPLVARFPNNQGRTFHINLEEGATLNVKRPFGPMDTIHVRAAANASVHMEKEDDPSLTEEQTETVLAPYQDDVASFEVRTAHWLFVTPRVLELHAVIRYRIGTECRSQVVPFSLSIRPPVKALMFGSVTGSLLGFLARQLSQDPFSLAIAPAAVSLAGIAVMAIILSIVLSRQDGSKGFVTLEDFYGAFIVGVLLGYTGSSYFDGILHTIHAPGPAPAGG